MDIETFIYVDNHSDISTLLYFPLIGMEGGIYPDTTIGFEKKNVGYPTKPGKRAYAGISNISLEDWILTFPKDTVSIYIFSQDIVDKYDWSEIQSNYKILQRYDLSIKDFEKLSDTKSGVPIITYPPTKEMKDMKMWPSYENK
jgi:replication initiation and membrane attachment protein DnaB